MLILDRNGEGHRRGSGQDGGAEGPGGCEAGRVAAGAGRRVRLFCQQPKSAKNRPLGGPSLVVVSRGRGRPGRVLGVPCLRPVAQEPHPGQAAGGLPQAQVLAEQPDGAWRMLSLLLGSTPRAIREDQGAAAVRDADWPFLHVRLLLAHLGGLRRDAVSDEERREMVWLSRPDGSHLMGAPAGLRRGHPRSAHRARREARAYAPGRQPVQALPGTHAAPRGAGGRAAGPRAHGLPRRCPVDGGVGLVDPRASCDALSS